MYGASWLPCLTAIVRAILAAQDVYLVISNDDGHAASNPYSTSTLGTTAAEAGVLTLAAGKLQGLSTAAIAELLCTRFNLAPLRFGDSSAWPNGLWTYSSAAAYTGPSAKQCYFTSFASPEALEAEVTRIYQRSKTNSST